MLKDGVAQLDPDAPYVDFLSTISARNESLIKAILVKKRAIKLLRKDLIKEK